MYEYNSDKILQRQKICLKCKSFVTHEKVEEGALTCPLCSHKVKHYSPKPNKISTAQMKVLVAEFYEEAYARLKGKREDKAVSKESSEIPDRSQNLKQDEK